MAQFSPVRFLPFVILVALLVSLPLVSGFSLVGTGSTLTLDSVYYYVPTTPFAHINPISLRGYTSKELSENTLFPVTVVSGKNEGFGIQELEDTVSDFAKDDVWGKGFLECE